MNYRYKQSGVLIIIIIFCIFIGEIGGIDPPLNGSTLCPSHLLSNVSLNNVIMGKRIEYEHGDLIRGVKFIKDIGGKNKYSGKKQYYRRALFECPYCENNFEADISAIKNTGQKSCGCLRCIVRNPYYRTRLYGIWDHIKQRCSNPNSNNYHNYGGRGIAMYTPWINNPVAFIEYCMTLPGHDNKKLSIDRVKTDGNYQPGNLRFTTKDIQNRNRRSGTTNESGYVGVIIDKRRPRLRYISQLSINNKKKYIGTYNDAITAIKARDQYIIDNNSEGFNLQVL